MLLTFWISAARAWTPRLMSLGNKPAKQSPAAAFRLSQIGGFFVMR